MVYWSRFVKNFFDKICLPTYVNSKRPNNFSTIYIFTSFHEPRWQNWKSLDLWIGKKFHSWKNELNLFVQVHRIKNIRFRSLYKNFVIKIWKRELKFFEIFLKTNFFDCLPKLVWYDSYPNQKKWGTNLTTADQISHTNMSVSQVHKNPLNLLHKLFTSLIILKPSSISRWQPGVCGFILWEIEEVDFFVLMSKEFVISCDRAWTFFFTNPNQVTTTFSDPLYQL